MNLIVNFTPTGMIPTKAMTEHVPLSVDEIVADVRAAVHIGITMVHLHARDAVGNPSASAEIYGRMIAGIRAFAPDLVICVSLSGRTLKRFEQRAEPLRLDGNLKPDMGSLTLSSLNFNKMESVNAPDMIKALAEEMLRRGIAPELEAFDAGMINYAKYLERKELLRPPHYFNLLLGNIACAQADLLHAGIMVRDLPDRSYWSFAGIGNKQLMMNALAICAGGGVRVGLEDNIYFDGDGARKATNSDLLRRIHTIATACERQVMKPAELRQLLELKGGFGQYGR